MHIHTLCPYLYTPSHPKTPLQALGYDTKELIKRFRLIGATVKKAPGKDQGHIVCVLLFWVLVCCQGVLWMVLRGVYALLLYSLPSPSHLLPGAVADGWEDAATITATSTTASHSTSMMGAPINIIVFCIVTVFSFVV